jgi:DNA gyrase subunit A
VSEETKSSLVAQTVAPLSIEKELKSSFLDYAMSVIVSRALPDVRDGLKPVHRRILYAMHTLGYYQERPYRKSATVVGEVIGHYHPHGDSAIYQSMVGLAQEFSKRYPLLDGQGNWGSIDGDNAAAMRYTEVRMAKLTRDVLADIEKETVAFQPNFDESRKEPVLLPSKIPNLLINGSNGIAVGMATSIPPHNLGEVVDACLALLKDPLTTDETLFSLIPAPDFPTGGVICGRSGILKAYRTGHGNVVVRGVVDIEETSNKAALIITEIPYQVNKSDLITKIADLVKNKVVEGITNIRDESNRDGIRVVIDLRRGEVPQVILNQLYKHTQLQTSQSIMLLALLNNAPVVFTLREMLQEFLIHRQEVVRKRTLYDLVRNRQRAHILAGLMRALDDIDAVIKTIKAAPGAQEAVVALRDGFDFSEAQAKAILDMRLQRLTGLEREKLMAEIDELKKIIAHLELILNDPEVLKGEIITELEEIRSSYSDPRRSSIEGAIDSFEDIDLIPNDEVVVTLTSKGYIKRVPLETYAVQHRGGKGKRGLADLSDSEDIIKDIFVARNHDELLFFTNLGRVYTLRVFEVPEGSRVAKGRAIVNLLPLNENETVVKLLSASELQKGYLVMVTKKGTIKKTEAKAFAKVRKTGIHAINLNEGDELSFCSMSSGNDDIVIATSAGQGIRFKEGEVRPMGRHSAGVRGIRMKGEAFVVGIEILEADDERDLLFATSGGYGKRVKIEDFRVAHRGGLGVRTIPTNKRNGDVVGVSLVSQESSILLIDQSGKIIRLAPHEVRTMRRGAQGVRLIRLDKGQRVVAIAEFDETASDEAGEGQKVTDLEPNLQAADQTVTIEADQVEEEGLSVVLETELSIDETTLDDEEDQDDDGAEA